MADENAVLSTVIRFDPPLDRPPAEAVQGPRGLAVELEGGVRVRLDAADPRSVGFAQVLDGLRSRELPVYVEFDPSSSSVTRLRIPYVSTVLAIRRLDAGLFDVVLAASHARHLLREESEDYSANLERLETAMRRRVPVIVVDDDAQHIIAVRLRDLGFGEPEPPFPEVPPRLRWPWRWFPDLRMILRPAWWWWWLWGRWFRCLSRDRADQIFAAMQAASCDPSTVPPPCIPFLYPTDGCWGRASQMCRLMLQQGVTPRKVWIQGQLNAPTRNDPDCQVSWGWHVAPTLCVRGWWLFLREEMVIDPSLFDAPVTKAQWKGVQGDPMATLTDTAHTVFHLFYPPQATDPTYALTDQVLATYRLALLNQTVTFGPAPYANCP